MWERFRGQLLRTGDLLMTDEGLAIVSSIYTTGEPSKISYIPNGGNFVFDNGGINQRTKEGESDEFLLPNGDYFYTNNKGWKCKVGKILMISKSKKNHKFLNQ